MKKNRFTTTTKVILINNLLYIVLGSIIYLLIPYLLNYPPNSIDNEFQTRVAGMQYTTQFFLIGMLLIAINSICIFFLFRPIGKWEKSNKLNKECKIEDIFKIRDICLNGIYKIMPIEVITIAIVMVGVLSVTSTEFVLTIKLSAIMCIWCIIANLVLNVFVSKIFNDILLRTYFIIQNKEQNIKKISIKNKILFQSVSLMIVIVFVLSLYSYSRINVERSHFLREKELNSLNSLISSQGDNIFSTIKESEKNYFILNTNFQEEYSKIPLSKFALEYIKEYADSNNLYFQYGSTIEGVFNKIQIEGKEYYIGIVYDVMSNSYTMTIVAFDIILLSIYIVIINFFAKSIRDELVTCSTKLYDIGNSKNEIGKELEVTSNDEFRDLIEGYNLVQKNTSEFIKNLNEKQDIIVKQGQLASIGELAGGVAHDINTPISAIKTGIVMLNTMTSERTEQEKEILQRMDNCASKIIKIVNSMRNQIRNLGGDTDIKFKISDVLRDIKIVTYHEVSKNKSEIIVDVVDDLCVKGDPTKLGQVLTNLVVNAAQAYGENGGKIEITVVSAPDSIAMIKVNDYAGGIDSKIAPYVFKNILTTKGTVGTGLGLYLAFSVIKGKFNGNITFDTCNNGTTFYINIPSV